MLPDYQGIGIGSSLLNFVAALLKKEGGRVRIVTAHPGVVASLSKQDAWICCDSGLKHRVNKSGDFAKHNQNFTSKRISHSFEYIG